MSHIKIFDFLALPAAIFGTAAIFVGTASRYQIAVTSQISTLNAGNAPMVSQCTGNMPGTTLVTPKQAQGSLQSSKHRQKHKNAYIRPKNVLDGPLGTFNLLRKMPIMEISTF